jgi:signal transduction histidine kinase
VAERTSENVLADFAHQLRQPLSALEALTSYLDLITKSEDTRVHEQLRRMHFEIGSADQILREGIRTLLAYFPSSSMTEVRADQAPEGMVEELSLPLTNSAMASVTY